MAGESRSRRITTVRVRQGRLYAGRRGGRSAPEEPLELRVNGRVLLTTMRSPGHDVELAHGHLFAAGVIAERSDVGEARFCEGAVPSGESGLPQNTYDVLDVVVRDLSAGFLVPPASDAPTSGEVSGEASIEAALGERDGALPLGPGRVDPELLLAAARTLADAGNGLGPATGPVGGAHTVLLVAPDGTPRVRRADVHPLHALDKAIGWALLAESVPATEDALVLTAPVGFATVRRAFLAGIGCVATTSAVTSLAVDAAARLGITLVGSLAVGEDGAEGEGRMDVHTHPERLDLTRAA